MNKIGRHSYQIENSYLERKFGSLHMTPGGLASVYTADSLYIKQ